MALAFLQPCRSGVAGLPALLSAALLLSSSASGCRPAGSRPAPKGAAASPPPAKVENPAKEGDLATVLLTSEAETRLGIKTVAVERKALRRTRTLGGEVTAPPGSAVTLSAPFGGTILSTSSELSPGQAVSKGQVLLTIAPLLLAEARASLMASQAEAVGALEAAAVQSEAAKATLQRAEQLLRDKAGSQRAVDDARAGFEAAQASTRAATAKRDLYSGLLSGTGSGAAALATLQIPSPVGGVVTKILMVPGQLVVAGAPLVEILNVERLWIRVPVYAGDLEDVATDEEVQIGSPGDPPGAPGVQAKPVLGPPTADPLALTVDLYYELVSEKAAVEKETSRQPRLTPGRRVAVTLPLRAPDESLVVPWSSVVHDSQGGTWVYETTSAQTFVRRRVEVRFVAEGLASLSNGPKPGANVVAEGAAELFGTEFGVGK